MLHDAYKKGIVAALEKLAVSNALYARAIMNAGQRTGAPTGALGKLWDNRSALRAMAQHVREPHTLVPSLGQQHLQDVLHPLPFMNSEWGHGGTLKQLDAALRVSGHTYAQPGVQQQILEQFGPARRGYDKTVATPSPFADTHVSGATDATAVGHRRQVA